MRTTGFAAALIASLLLAPATHAADSADWVNDPDLDGIVDLLDPDYQKLPINVARLPLKYAITTRYGSGERVVYTFEDPQCGFCRQLHRHLAAIGNLTVHTFVLTFLGPESASRADLAWCSPDRTRAWDAIMRGGSVAATTAANCKAPTAQTMKLAGMLGINLTPTVFYADGSRMNGVKPQAEVEARLRQASAAAIGR
ncbi:MAG TPA: DsbC family protein [Rhodocyclaceae bacterium]